MFNVSDFNPDDCAFLALYSNDVVIQWQPPQTWSRVFSYFKFYGRDGTYGELFCRKDNDFVFLCSTGELCD